MRFATALKRDPIAQGASFPVSHYRKRLARGLLQLGQAGRGPRGASSSGARSRWCSTPKRTGS